MIGAREAKAGQAGIDVGDGENEKRVYSISAANPLISGAGTRNRTRDTRIFSPLLYRLSYPGVKGESSENPCPCQDFFLRLQINDPAAGQLVVPGGMLLIHGSPEKTRPKGHG